MTTPSTSVSPAEAGTPKDPTRALPWPWIAVASFAFAAFVLRAGHEPFWLDETYSYAMVQHGFGDLFRLTTADVHPPLYYLLLKLSTLLVGDSPAALRLPSVLAATGLVALGAGPVRRVWDARTGWVFACLALSSAGLLCFAQEARMYALATLLVTAAVLRGHLAVRDGQPADFVAFGLLTWAASLTHYFALVAVGMNATILLFATATRARQRLRPLAVATALAMLGFLPWAPFFWNQVASVTKEFWIPPTSPNLVMFGLVAPFAYKYEDVPYPWQAVVALVGSVVVVVVALAVKRFRGSRAETLAALQLVAVFALTLGFGLAFSLLVRPIFMPRYMIVCAGLFLGVVATAIARLPPRAVVATTALFVLLGLPAWLRVQIQTFNGPFARLAHEVRAAGKPTPLLVHNGVPFSFALLPSSHAVPGARNAVLAPAGSGFDPTGGGLYDPRRTEAVEKLDGLLNSEHRIWFVDGKPGPDPVDAGPLMRDPRWRKQGADIILEEPLSWVKLTLRRYERHDAASSLSGGQ